MIVRTRLILSIINLLIDLAERKVDIKEIKWGDKLRKVLFKTSW